MAKRSSPATPRHWTEADARGVPDDWKRSGETLEAFARSRGLVPQRLAWWRKRLSASPAGPALTLVPAAVVGIEPAAPTAVIRLPQGIVIELASASPQWVAALARELTRPAT